MSSPSLSSLFNSVNGSATKDDYAEGGGEAPADGTLDLFNDGLSPEVDWNGMPSSTSAAGTSAAGSFSSRISQLSEGSEISVIAAMASETNVRLTVRSKNKCAKNGTLTEIGETLLSKCYILMLQFLDPNCLEQRRASSNDFEGLFSQEEACVLVDLLKLGVANRAGPNAKDAIASILLGMLFPNIINCHCS